MVRKYFEANSRESSATDFRICVLVRINAIQVKVKSSGNTGYKSCQ